MNLQLNWNRSSSSQSADLQNNLSLFYEYNWMCVPFIFLIKPRIEFDLKNTLQCLHDLLDVVPYDNLVNLFQSAYSLFSQVINIL